MEKRRFGRTGHRSTVAIFGAAAFYQVTQAQADVVMQQVIAAGVNHIDVAPSYGQAEERLGPWLARERERFFLGCKTQERGKQAAADELRRSLERLQVDAFDLHQLHAVTSLQELDQVTGPGGALEALVDARAEGLTRFVGITGHGVDSPAVFLEALNRFDFDSVLFPLNFVQFANPVYRENTRELLEQCRARDVGVMVIKSVCKGPWGDRPHTYSTWYEPFADLDNIQQCVNFALSQAVTGLCTAGDINILPLFLKACHRFVPMSAVEQEAQIARAEQYEPLFPPQGVKV
jgi:aryl-alcohol dehydrogenase-like predicted oxidoreductase